jgi:hypothetical protein
VKARRSLPAMFLNRRNKSVQLRAVGAQLGAGHPQPRAEHESTVAPPADSRAPAPEARLSELRESAVPALETPEARHRACWYSRRTDELPLDIGFHTIEDGQLLFCAHPMWFPVVGYQFDVGNCGRCDYYKPVRRQTARL